MGQVWQVVEVSCDVVMPMPLFFLAQPRLFMRRKRKGTALAARRRIIFFFFFLSFCLIGF